MNEHDDLNKELKALAHCFPRQAGAHVEQKVLAGFRQQRRQRIWLRVGIAACVAAIAGMTAWQMKQTPSPIRSPKQEMAAVRQVEPETVPAPSPQPATPVHHKRHTRHLEPIDVNFTGFISLPSAIGSVPLGTPYIVRTTVSAGQLRFAGLPVIASDLQQQVEADVLVGSDGMARAIRIAR